jgi:hypothetical protein
VYFEEFSLDVFLSEGLSAVGYLLAELHLSV